MPDKSLQRLNRAAQESFLSIQDSGDQSLYRQFISLYMKTSDEFLNALKSAAGVQQAKNASHSWRSSSSAIGAEVLADLCWQIEQLQDSSSLPGLIARVETEYEALKAEMKPLVDQVK